MSPDDLSEWVSRLGWMLLIVALVALAVWSWTSLAPLDLLTALRHWLEGLGPSLMPDLPGGA